MSSTNVVVLSGHLCADPELRSVGQGKSVCDLRLAVNCDYGSGDQRREETCFIDVVAWERLAENCNQYLRKGDKVIVNGHLKYEEWDDKETGKKRSKHRVTARTIEFPSKREAGRDDQGGGQRGGQSGQNSGRWGDDKQSGGQGGNRPAQGGGQQGDQGGGVNFDDIPFAVLIPLTLAITSMMA